MFGIKAKLFQVKYMMIFDTDRTNHYVTTKAQKDMAIVNKQRKVKYRHANEYRQQIHAYE
jgi:hypothetical protein